MDARENQSKQVHCLGDMPYALNVWVYECRSVVDDEIAVKEGDYIHRICNWRVVGVKPKFEMFMSNIFTENACTNMQPTSKELTVLDLPDNMGVLILNILHSAGNVPDLHSSSSEPKENKDIPDIEEVKQ
ncbi:hypothetical protein MTR67_039525 [Solanum verrucosum]|uniref:Uncharacterized protein n=1 Tax=Solanum verrucosum TaxID=315347 RepID=A0AAF0UI35_SOLVR|nr:hypothetical protein MTR67_039525 [Solanum verrucosum]